MPIALYLPYGEKHILPYKTEKLIKKKISKTTIIKMASAT